MAIESNKRGENFEKSNIINYYVNGQLHYDANLNLTLVTSE